MTKKLREAIIDFNQTVEGRFNFSQIKLAIPYLKVENKIIVVIKKSDLILNFINHALAVLLGLAGTTLIVLTSIPGGTATFIQLIILFSVGAFMVFLSIFVISQTFPIYSAKLIKQYLSEMENNKSNE